MSAFQPGKLAMLVVCNGMDASKLAALARRRVGAAGSCGGPPRCYLGGAAVAPRRVWCVRSLDALGLEDGAPASDAAAARGQDLSETGAYDSDALGLEDGAPASDAAAPRGQDLSETGRGRASPPSQVESLKTDSKNAGAHKTRQLLWAAYGAIATTLGGVEGAVAGFLKYNEPAVEGEDGAASFEAFTKKQAHALGQGGLELMGRKLRPLEEPESKQWAVVFCEGDEAVDALDDIKNAEACVYVVRRADMSLMNHGGAAAAAWIFRGDEYRRGRSDRRAPQVTATACYVGTRLKRRHCKNVSALKTQKDLEKFLEDVKPALQSVDWTGSKPAAMLPSFCRADISSTNRGGAAAATWIFRGDGSRRRRGRSAETARLRYNTLLAGPGFPAPLVAALPAGVGHAASAAPGDVYDAARGRAACRRRRRGEPRRYRGEPR